MSRVAKQAQWRKRVSTFERSGLTRKAWCLRADVAVSTLDYWRSRLRDAGDGSDEALVPIIVLDEPMLASRRAGASTIAIEFGGGLFLRADAQVDAQWLASVLRVALMLRPKGWWLAVAPVDLRCGMDRLLVAVQAQLRRDGFDGTACVFRNKSRPLSSDVSRENCEPSMRLSLPTSSLPRTLRR